jgi:hypothetical protein
MLCAASPAWEGWSELSTRLPPDLDLEERARSTRAVQRRRGDGIIDGATLLRLSLARGPGGMSLQQTAAWAYLNGVAEVTAQSLNERLHRSVAFLAGVLHRLLAGRAGGKPERWSGRGLRMADGGSLSQPGSQGTDGRLHAVDDLARGGFSHVEVTDKTGAESRLHAIRWPVKPQYGSLSTTVAFSVSYVRIARRPDAPGARATRR